MECQALRCRPPYFMRRLLLAPLILALASSVQAHPKGIYKTQNEARQQSAELQCVGIHKNGDYWMPCADEKDYTKHLEQDKHERSLTSKSFLA